MSEAENSKRPRRGTRSTRSTRQMRYLSQAAQLEEAVNPRIVGVTMIMVSLAILAFLVWAGFTNINEMARTSGEVVPQGFQQSVQHLEGGLIKEIRVAEGDIADKGTVLVVLDDAVIRDDLENVELRLLALRMRAERLRALVERREPDLRRFASATPAMLSDSRAFFTAMRIARQREAAVIEDQISQRRHQLRAHEGDLEVARANLAIAREVYDRRSRLQEKGHASRMQLLEDKRRLNDVEGSAIRLENRILLAREEIGEFEQRLASLSARHTDEASQQLSAILVEIDDARETLDKLQERLGRMTIKAPTRGLVKGLAINTIGAVITPGQTLMEIVPIDKALEVLVRISPRDIGHIAVGQDVVVKVSSYDFSRYGSIPGQLAHVSATTFAAADGSRFYQARIQLGQNYVGQNPDNIVLPGMTVTADIVTGRKTILQYILKPIHVSLQTALTER